MMSLKLQVQLSLSLGAHGDRHLAKHDLGMLLARCFELLPHIDCLFRAHRVEFRISPSVPYIENTPHSQTVLSWHDSGGQTLRLVKKLLRFFAEKYGGDDCEASSAGVTT